MPTKTPTSLGAMPRSRPISGASTDADVAASAVKIWIASVIASALAAGLMPERKTRGIP
jgi:hypothetical protein